MACAWAARPSIVQLTIQANADDNRPRGDCVSEHERNHFTDRIDVFHVMEGDSVRWLDYGFIPMRLDRVATVALRRAGSGESWCHSFSMGKVNT